MKSLTEQRKIIEAATPGPWRCGETTCGPKSFDVFAQNNFVASCGGEGLYNAPLIVAARNDYPDLLTWAENARTQLDVFQAVCESAPEPILGDWNWPQLKKEIEQLLAELPE